jgi:EAL domain-containing protein (putative c-di-GMP-specific phosphodiesterase class I)
VPEAEQTHTFLAVQRWVIDESCRQLAEWRASGTADALVLRLNVPGTLAAHGEITRTLLHAIDRYQVPAARICVELTERSMPDDVAPLAAELAGWRELGMTVAIDDFGIGHATLTHLVTLPLDVIKIDQSFVARLAVDERAAAVVAGVIGLARSLGLDVVAEGINGTSTSTELVRLGCTRGQGNALAPAMEPEQIESLLPYQR